MESIPCAISSDDNEIVECGKFCICFSKKEICLSSCSVNFVVPIVVVLPLIANSVFRSIDIDVGLGEIVHCSFSKDALCKIKRLLSLYVEDDKESENREISRSFISVMKSFALQKLAFDFYSELLDSDRKLGDTLKLYSYESAHSGQRRFLVCDEESFVTSYLKTAKKHVYEIIPNNSPCRLYLDLEYNKEFNPQLERLHCKGMLHPLIATVIKLIQSKLYELFKITITDSEFVILDSSNPSKFSHHIIVIIPLDAQCIASNTNTICACSKCKSIANGNSLFVCKKRKLHSSVDNELLFKNNREVGKFIELIISDMTNPLEITHDSSSYSSGRNICIPKAEYEQFWVYNKLPTDLSTNDLHNKSCFIDRGVYTKNRAFRILLSTKHNKTSVMAVYAPDTTNSLSSR